MNQRSTEFDDQPRSAVLVSVVVATHNRCDLLTRLIGSLRDQTATNFLYEIIIVNDGSTDSTRSVLDKLTNEQQSEHQIRVFHLAQNAGAAAARNFGTKKALGQIIAFTDDDCVPAINWLESGVKIAGSGTIVVGKTQPPNESPVGPFARTLRVNDARYMQTCNIFYAKNDLIKSGGFDERFRGAAGEDTDLGLRIQESGGEAIFCPEAIVAHDVRPSLFSFALREAWGKWIDLPLVVKLHPEIRERLQLGVFWKPSHPHITLATLSIGLGVLYFWPLVGMLPWVHYRMRVMPITPNKLERISTLPGAFAIDLAETIAMVRGSIRHRTFLL